MTSCRRLEHRVAGLFITDAQIGASAAEIFMTKMLPDVFDSRLTNAVHGDGVLEDVRMMAQVTLPRPHETL